MEYFLGDFSHPFKKDIFSSGIIWLRLLKIDPHSTYMRHNFSSYIHSLFPKNTTQKNPTNITDIEVRFILLLIKLFGLQLWLPTPEQWPGIQSLPKYSTFKTLYDLLLTSQTNYHESKLQNGTYDRPEVVFSKSNFYNGWPPLYAHIISYCGQDGLDLLLKMIHPNPYQRITVEKALSHSYFSQNSLPSDFVTSEKND